MNESKVKLSGISLVFDVPQEAGAALGAIVERGVEAYGKLLLPDVQAFVPSDAKIDKEWDGICEQVAERFDQFRLQSEGLSRQIADKARDVLNRKRQLEQLSGNVLTSDLLAEALGALGGEPLPEAKRQERIAAILTDLRGAEEKLKKATRSPVLGRAGRVEARRLELEKIYSKAVGAVRRFVQEQCQSISSSYVRPAIEGHLHQMDECIQWLHTECQEERRRERRRILEEDPAWLGEGHSGHRASIAPKGQVVEKALRRLSPFGGAQAMELGTFWRAFGAWCSEHGIVATVGGPHHFAQRLGTFIHEVADGLFGSATLGQLYASARESLPLEQLKTACKPPFPLADSQEVRAAAHNAVRIVQVPDAIRQETQTRLGSKWTAKESDDPNLLTLVECYDGISVRSIILNGNPDWQDSLHQATIQRHASSPRALEALQKSAIIRRLGAAESR